MTRTVKAVLVIRRHLLLEMEAPCTSPAPILDLRCPRRGRWLLLFAMLVLTQGCAGHPKVRGGRCEGLTNWGVMQKPLRCYPVATTLSEDRDETLLIFRAGPGREIGPRRGMHDQPVKLAKAAIVSALQRASQLGDARWTPAFAVSRPSAASAAQSFLIESARFCR